MHPLKTKVCWESCFGFAKTVADFGKAVSDCEETEVDFPKKKGDVDLLQIILNDISQSV